MKQIKFMTNAQIKRIQDNNYCSEHDRNGNQFDYEANGYREEIDAMIWERNKRYIEGYVVMNDEVYFETETFQHPLSHVGKIVFRNENDAYKELKKTRGEN